MSFSLRLLLCLCVACGGDDSDHHQHHVDAGPAASGDGGQGLQGDTYLAGLEKVSTDGHFRVALVESTPIPQDLTFYTWTVEVRDAQGSVLDQASVVAEPTMPEHGHGTFPVTTPGVATGEIGRFTLTDMDLFMAGTWQIELRVTHSEVTDTVFFYFTLDS
jgi:hypothetical protein